MGPAKKKAPLFNKLANSKDSGAGYDLVGNIVVGLGLVWIVRYFFPGVPKAWYAAGVVLGAVSGFYQLFKAQGRPTHKEPYATEHEKHEHDPRPPDQLP